MRIYMYLYTLICIFTKGAKVYGKAASETDVGKQAQKVNQNIRDKIEDAREFWETSQNPVVHTLSNVWDSLTGETEEGIAVAAIRKKDPKFIKVCIQIGVGYIEKMYQPKRY